MHWSAEKINTLLLKAALLGLGCVCVWFVFTAGQPIQAATGIPAYLNYQGKLTDSGSTAVSTSTVAFRFQLYDAASGGNLLWSERWTGTTSYTTSTNGIFSAKLGSLTESGASSGSLANLDWNSDSIYLQIHLDTDNNGSWEEEFSTRKQITTSGYAFNASKVAGFSATSTAAAASTLLALDSNGVLNLFDSGVSSTQSTTTESIFVGNPDTASVALDRSGGDLYVQDDVEIDSDLTVGNKATSTVAIWIGSAGTADNIDLAGGDLYVQDALEVDGEFFGTTGRLSVLNASTTNIDTLGIFTELRVPLLHASTTDIDTEIISTFLSAPDARLSVINATTTNIDTATINTLLTSTDNRLAVINSTTTNVDLLIGADNRLAVINSTTTNVDTLNNLIELRTPLIHASSTDLDALLVYGSATTTGTIDVQEYLWDSTGDLNLTDNVFITGQGTTTISHWIGTGGTADNINLTGGDLYVQDALEVDGEFFGTTGRLSVLNASTTNIDTLSINTELRVPLLHASTTDIDTEVISTFLSAPDARLTVINSTTTNVDTLNNLTEIRTPLIHATSTDIDTLTVSGSGTIGGSLGVGAVTPSSTLHVVGLIGSQLFLTNQVGDLGTKYGTIGIRHYNNAEEAFLATAGESNLTQNNLFIGGGLGEFNSATQITFNTAANNTTVTGSERMRINASGLVSIGSAAEAAYRLEVSDPTATTTFYVVGNSRLEGTATSTVAHWVGSGGTADNINLAGGDLYVQDALEVDGEFFGTTGRLSVLNASTTNIDTLAVFGNATIDGNATTSGNLIVSGNIRTPGTIYASSSVVDSQIFTSATSTNFIVTNQLRTPGTILATSSDIGTLNVLTESRNALLHASTTDIGALLVDGSATTTGTIDVQEYLWNSTGNLSINDNLTISGDATTTGNGFVTGNFNVGSNDIQAGLLTVATAGSATTTIGNTSAVVANDLGGFEWRSGAGLTSANKTASIYATRDSVAQGSLHFTALTSVGGTQVEALTISSSGGFPFVGVATSTPGGTFQEALTIVGNSYQEGLATSTVALWLGTGGSADNINLTGGDLYVQDALEVDGEFFGTTGRLSVLNASTTNIDTLGIFTEIRTPLIHASSTDFDALLVYGSATTTGTIDVQEYLWDSTGDLNLTDNTVITGNATTTGSLAVLNGDVAFDSDATNVYLQTFGTKPLFVNSTGNNVVFQSGGSGAVGIGATPAGNAANLYISNTTNVTPATQSTYSFVVAQGGVPVAIGGDANFGYIQSFNSLPLQINSQGNNVLLNAAGGSVGIGLTTPTSTLSVNGSLAVWGGTSDVFTVSTAGKATSTVAIWIGSAGTADNIDLTGGDLYVQDSAEIDGELFVTTAARIATLNATSTLVDNATSTGSVYAGTFGLNNQYINSWTDLLTQGVSDWSITNAAHTSGTSTIILNSTDYEVLGTTYSHRLTPSSTVPIFASSTATGSGEGYNILSYRKNIGSGDGDSAGKEWVTEFRSNYSTTTMDGTTMTFVTGVFGSATTTLYDGASTATSTVGVYGVGQAVGVLGESKSSAAGGVVGLAHASTTAGVIGFSDVAGGYGVQGQCNGANCIGGYFSSKGANSYALYANGDSYFSGSATTTKYFAVGVMDNVTGQFSDGDVYVGNHLYVDGNSVLFDTTGVATTTAGGTFGEKFTVSGNTYLEGIATTSMKFIVGTNSVVTDDFAGSIWFDRATTTDRIHVGGANSTSTFAGHIEVTGNIGGGSPLDVVTDLIVYGNSTTTDTLMVSTSTLVAYADTNLVGIGTLAPTSTLAVAGNVNVQDSAGTSVLFVSTATNQVGIGTTAPASTMALDVYGNVQINNGGDLYFATENSIRGLDGLVGFNDLRFYADNAETTELMRLHPSGSLSLGTTYVTTDLGSAGGMIMSGTLGVGTAAPWGEYQMTVASSTATTTLYVVGNTRLEGNATTTGKLVVGENSTVTDDNSGSIWFDRATTTDRIHVGGANSTSTFAGNLQVTGFIEGGSPLDVVGDLISWGNSTTTDTMWVGTSTAPVLFADGQNRRVAVGTASSSVLHLGAIGANSTFTVREENMNTVTAQFYRHSNDTANNILFARTRGSVDTWAALQSSDDAGILNFYGYDGNSFLPVGIITTRIHENTTPAINDFTGQTIIQVAAGGTNTADVLKISALETIFSTATGGTTLEVMRTDNGSLGVGTTTPWALLSVADDTTSTTTIPLFVVEDTLRADSTVVRVGSTVDAATSSLAVTGNLNIQDSANTSVLFVDSTAGKVGIGTTTPGNTITDNVEKLTIEGSVFLNATGTAFYASTTYAAASGYGMVVTNSAADAGNGAAAIFGEFRGSSGPTGGTVTTAIYGAHTGVGTGQQVGVYGASNGTGSTNRGVFATASNGTVANVGLLAFITGTTASDRGIVVDSTGTGNGSGINITDGTFYVADNATTTGTLTVGSPTYPTNTNAGDVIISGTFYNNSTANNDYAEVIATSESTEPGDILSIDTTQARRFRRSRSAYDSTAVGVVSTNPAFIAQADEIINASGVEYTAPMALAGQVPVKVNTQNGPIRVGDSITTSDTIGHGMRAESSNTGIVGIAQEDFPSLANPGTVNPVTGYTEGKVFILVRTPNSAVAQAAITEPSAQNGELTVVENPDFTVTTLAVQQAATFYGTILVKGEAGFEQKVTFKESVTFKAHVYVDRDTAGSATIKAGEATVEIKFKTPYLTDPKVVANPTGTASEEGAEEFASWVITKKSLDGFTIKLSEPAQADLTFDWIALANAPGTPATIREVTVTPPTIAAGETTEVAVSIDEVATDYEFTWTDFDAGGTFSGEGATVTYRPAADYSGNATLAVTISAPGAETIGEVRLLVQGGGVVAGEETGGPTDPPTEEPAPVVEPAPEPTPEPTPEPIVEPAPEPTPVVEPSPEPTPEPVAEPTPEPASEPVVEPAPVPAP